eukprot:430740_1
MAPRSISPMYTSREYTYNSLLSDEFHFGIHSMAAPSTVKRESNDHIPPKRVDVVDLTYGSISDSNSDLEFITHEIIDLTIKPKKKRKKKRKRKKRKKHKKPKEREVIELSESESDDLLEGDETRHAVNLSASSSTSEIKKAVERVCFQNLLFKNRVEFLCQMVKSILREEHETEGKNAESRSPAIKEKFFA